MQKVVRITLGTAIVGLVLYAADLATRDCRVAQYRYENCLWAWVMVHSGLPSNPLLRMVLLEGVGITLVFLLYLTLRYVFLFRRGSPASSDTSRPNDPEPPPN